MAVSSETVALLLGSERNPFARRLLGAVRARARRSAAARWGRSG